VLLIEAGSAATLPKFNLGACAANAAPRNSGAIGEFLQKSIFAVVGLARWCRGNAHDHCQL